MHTDIARREIMRQAVSARAGRADRTAALTLVVTRLVALLGLAGLLVAVID